MYDLAHKAPLRRDRVRWRWAFLSRFRHALILSSERIERPKPLLASPATDIFGEELTISVKLEPTDLAKCDKF